MQEADLYFTHTIVGAPFTVPLGKPQQLPALHRDALSISARSGRLQLGGDWLSWFSVYARGQAPIGAPWRVPGKFRRFLMRYALVLALSGWLVAALLAAAVAGVLAYQATDSWHWSQPAANAVRAWLQHLH